MVEQIPAGIYSMMDEMIYFLTGSQKSEWQVKENLHVLNETVWVAVLSLSS